MSKELCNKTKKECGYLNFTNDVLDLMKKHKIKDVSTLETILKDYEELKKLKLFPYPKVNDEEYRRSVIKRLQAFEIIKEYFVLTNEYGKISFELNENIEKDKYDFLKEVLKDD